MRTMLAALAVAAMIVVAPDTARPASAADIPADLDIDVDSLIVSKSELVCLALNDYWESRGEPMLGRVAVAQVVLNRAMDRKYPSNLCDVVKQSGPQRRTACQFSWHCDGKSDHPTDTAAWRDSLLIASAVLSRNSSIVDPTGGAKWYHARRVNPAWSANLRVSRVISGHVFYRDDKSSAASEAPYNFADWIADRSRFQQLAHNVATEPVEND